MKEICYEFKELDTDAYFSLLGSAFNGVLKNNSLDFDNAAVKGELLKKNVEHGLWIRKWKLTVFQKIMLQKKPADKGAELKYNLIYFLNPAIFSLKKKLKKIPINTQHNKLFFSNQVPIDFSVIPNQPFYVLDIAFTASWVMQQLDDSDPCLNSFLDQYYANPKNIFTEPCSIEDYKTLHELDVSLLAEKNDLLFARSRIYKLVCTFFNKKIDCTKSVQTHGLIHYDQVVQAEAIISGSLQAPPKLETIAKNVNMSVSSLLRQFKIMYGRSIHEYYVEKKMELAKKMILQERMAVKEIAGILGYKQASPFIEAFTKFYGYSPGSLRTIGE